MFWTLRGKQPLVTGKKEMGGREIENWSSVFPQEEDCVFHMSISTEDKSNTFSQPTDCSCFPPFSKQKGFFFNWLIPEAFFLTMKKNFFASYVYIF